MNAGTVIKKLRREKGMTQNELAELLKVSKASVQKYEQGDVQNLKAEMLRKLCLLFDVPPFVFIFPEHLDGEKETVSEVYKWTEILNTLTIFSDLNENSRIKAIDFINILNIAEHYNKEKD